MNVDFLDQSLAGRCVGALLVVAVVACAPGFNAESGGDASRSSAVEIPTDEAVDDRVSADQGDHTDWKRFQLPTTSSVILRFWWDDPSVRTTVQVRDEHGKQLHQAVHEGEDREDVFGPVNLEPGVYYVQIEAQAGASVYTFRLDTGPGQGSPGGGRPGF
jgi:hypothetical protein